MYQPFLKKNIVLDEWVKKIILWHFSPETGSPYWLNKLNKISFDPVKEIHTYRDLEKFGFFNEDDLRFTPIEEFIPAGFKDTKSKAINVYETGGTLGHPKRIVDFQYRDKLARWLSYSIDKHGFGSGGNWLHIGPSGPHVVGRTTAELAKIRGGLCFYIDIDTRWVKKCLKNNWNIVKDYMDHIFEQVEYIIETQDVRYVFTTPKLIQQLYERLTPSSIEGIVCGGTHVTPGFHKLLREEIIPDIPFCILYGNTIMGIAPQYRNYLNTNWDIDYYGFFPSFVIEVVDFENPTRIVKYGDIGRIKISTLTKDIFIPNLLERDEGIRITGNDVYGWDGVANVRPYSKFGTLAVEGVY